MSAVESKRGGGWARGAAVLSMVLLAASQAAGHEGHDHAPQEPSTVASAMGSAKLSRLADGSVNVPKLAQRRMAVRTEVAAQSQAAATVVLPARVVADPNASGRVQATHGGRIEAGPRGLPVAGQAVRKGDVLAWVHHHADPYARGGQEALRAELQTNRLLAEQRLRRLESLEGTVARKEIDEARAQWQSLQERERVIASSLQSREALRSPVSGIVARAEVVVGQVVEGRDVLFEIVDPARWMIEAVTPDASLAPRIASAALGEGVAPGVIVRFVGAARALREGVLPLHFTVRGSSKAQSLPLALGQSVQLIVGLRETELGVVLPAQAVVRNAANEAVVWRKLGAERFAAQVVQWRALDAQQVLITQGVAAGDRVVVQGATLLAQIR